MKRKFLEGFMNPKPMLMREDWFIWTNVAIEADRENSELVIFKIPKNELGLSDYETISKIEELLQTIYPTL